MEEITIDLSWLCLVIPLGITIVVAILGTRYRLRYAQRIFDAMKRGAFNDMDAPQQKNRFRGLALTALVGVIGSLSSLILSFFQGFGLMPIPVEICIASFGIFGTLAVIAGFLMQKEIDRRL